MNLPELHAAIRQRNRVALPRMIEIERRALAGERLTRTDNGLLIDVRESAWASRSLADPDLYERALALHLQMLCDSIGRITLNNEDSEPRHPSRSLCTGDLSRSGFDAIRQNSG
jgi:hypothetical protein